MVGTPQLDDDAPSQCSQHQTERQVPSNCQPKGLPLYGSSGNQTKNQLAYGKQRAGEHPAAPFIIHPRREQGEHPSPYQRTLEPATKVKNHQGGNQVHCHAQQPVKRQPGVPQRQDSHEHVPCCSQGKCQDDGQVVCPGGSKLPGEEQQPSPARGDGKPICQVGEIRPDNVGGFQSLHCISPPNFHQSICQSQM